MKIPLFPGTEAVPERSTGETAYTPPVKTEELIKQIEDALTYTEQADYVILGGAYTRDDLEGFVGHTVTRDEFQFVAGFLVGEVGQHNRMVQVIAAFALESYRKYRTEGAV